MRLINADDINCENLPRKLYPHLKDILDFIDSQPTVEERKQGEWKTDNVKHDGYDIAGVNTWYIECTCSCCNFKIQFIEAHSGQYNYCPYCGADMRGSENE